MSKSQINFAFIAILCLNLVLFGIFHLLIASQKPPDKYIMALLQTLFIAGVNGAIALLLFLFSYKAWKKWFLAAIISFLMGVIMVIYYLISV